MTLAERVPVASARPEVEIRLLGGFEVTLRAGRDGGGRGLPEVLPEEVWRRRQAAALVKLLALAPGRRLHRERVLDALWPDVPVDEAAPRLHKAAHYARRALRDPEGVLLRGEVVTLCPDRDATIDVRVFEDLAERALGPAGTGGSPAGDAAAHAANAYGGALLPDDLYEPWTQADRDRLRLLYLRLLRAAGRWERVLAEDPADEEAHLTLMRGYIARGERHAALRQFERMDRALRRELGVGPGPDALALRAAALLDPRTLPSPSASAPQPPPPLPASAPPPATAVAVARPPAAGTSAARPAAAAAANQVPAARAPEAEALAAGGQRPAGERSGGERSGGERSSGERADGERSDGARRAGEGTDGRRGAEVGREAGAPRPRGAAAVAGLVGRDAELRLVERVLDRVGGGFGADSGGATVAAGAAGHGGAAAVLVGGPAGVGKSALLDAVTRRAAAVGWQVGVGTAAAVEGAWPYAPVLEALADLCRRRPALLGEIDERFRSELERAMSGRDLEWPGAGGHQRLFIAAAELLRAAAEGADLAGSASRADDASHTGPAGAADPAGSAHPPGPAGLVGSAHPGLPVAPGTRRGVLLVVDDLQDADDASLRLAHYLVRSLSGRPVVLLLAHRPLGAAPAVLAEIRASLLGRGAAVAVDLAPLDQATTAALVTRESTLAGPLVERIWEVSGGLPSTALQLARRAALDPENPLALDTAVIAGLARAARDLLCLLAVAGDSFDTDEFVALSGRSEPDAYALLDDLLDRGVLDRTGGGFRFRHQAVRHGLLADLAPHRLRMAHREVADRLAAAGGPAGRVGHHLVQAGERARAVPFVLRAVETAAALGAYRDALTRLDEVREYATGADAAALAALRADLLVALADPSAPDAYRAAIALCSPADARIPRARLARALLVAGDLDGAAAALDGLEPDGGPADLAILLGRGHLAYFRGDIDEAAAIADEGGRRFVSAPTTRFGFDLISLRGLVSHSRGEYFAQLTADLRHSSRLPGLATTVFDAHLCVAEIMLYGPTPYTEVVSIADRLAEAAEQAGAARGLAFAACLAGEARLLSGDLERAERRLAEAVDLHRGIGATSGEAHSLQRLAEARLARGDAADANRLLLRALPLARWSPIAAHLLHRIHGTLIAAAPDAAAAAAALTRVEETLGVEDGCVFCSVTSAVPATVAAARWGDLARAHRHLVVARSAAVLWDGTAWQAATQEAEAYVARLEGDTERAGALLVAAGRLFDYVGHPLDAARCYGALTAAEAGLNPVGGDVVG
ncbi:ATP-binding protein [Pseudofrankia asymbiotica]|nr:AAA family ATPase [Pseudofrankia asymbiotica]